MKSNITWTKFIDTLDRDNTPIWKLFLVPSFMDLSTTDFPEGISFCFEGEYDQNKKMEAIKTVDLFFNTLIQDYKESKEYSMISNSGTWTLITWDADWDSMKLVAHIRLLPDFMCVDTIGMPYGLSILNKTYESEAKTSEDVFKITYFMEQLLYDYDKMQEVV